MSRDPEDYDGPIEITDLPREELIELCTEALTSETNLERLLALYGDHTAECNARTVTGRVRPTGCDCGWADSPYNPDNKPEGR